ncbi:phage portal protein [Rhodoplanes roseus]|uniref:Phage portal protein n=1 Tax=Rhodoplanes roseus TaxID=29409 RepID=A0A327L1W9_9BRAD|nr:phage portal protein [Rhodoplanes roseus]RAI43975.1 phage portal protein [Rhodoplanes roseus]
MDLKRIFRRTEVKALDTSLLELLGGTAGATSAGVPISPAGALRVPAVACAVRVIAEAVATLPLVVSRVAPDGSRAPVLDHVAAKLLGGDVCPWASASDFLLAMTADALLHDDGGLAVVTRVSGEPRELIRYRPGVVSVAYDVNTDEPTYSISGAPLDPADVIQLRSPLGRAPVSLAREAIGLALALEQHGARLFGNGARPSGVLSLDPKVRYSPETVANMRAAWLAAHGGAKSGGTAIVQGSYSPIALTSVDAQFHELRQFQILEIARAFRVPPSMLFDLARATWSNMEQLSREFLVYSLGPWLRAWEGALRRALLTDEERAAGLTISFETDDLTAADISARAVAYSSLISSRVLNPNEARRWEGLPPYAGGEAFINPNIATSTAGVQS